MTALFIILGAIGVLYVFLAIACIGALPWLCRDFDEEEA